MSGRIQKLERQLTGTDEDNMSDLSESPSLTPRPDSPSSLPLSPSRPASSRRESRITLEAELKKSRQAEEVGHTVNAITTDTDTTTTTTCSTTTSRRESRITLEAELKKSRQAEEVGHTFIASSRSSSIFKKLLVGNLQEV
jgi:hypothetical protein